MSTFFAKIIIVNAGSAWGVHPDHFQMCGSLLVGSRRLYKIIFLSTNLGCWSFAGHLIYTTFSDILFSIFFGKFQSGVTFFLLEVTCFFFFIVTLEQGESTFCSASETSSQCSELFAFQRAPL